MMKPKELLTLTGLIRLGVFMVGGTFIAVFGIRLAWEIARLVVVPFWLSIMLSCQAVPKPAPQAQESPFWGLHVIFDSTNTGTDATIQMFDRNGCEIFMESCEDSDSVIIYGTDTSYIMKWRPIRFRIKAVSN